MVHSSKGNSVVETKEFPMKPTQVLKYFSDQLTDFEKGEILGYPLIYFIGEKSEKI